MNRGRRGSVTAVTSLRMSVPAAFVACAATLAMTLTACGSDSESSTASSSSAIPAAPSTVTQMSTDENSCPTAPPAPGGTPEWTLPGATGSVAVTGSTATAAPLVTVTSPFSVTETQVHTLVPGAGPVVADTATVSVCYMGVNGRDGSVFDSSYQRGEPVDFPLNGVVPGFQKAIAGQTVGSTVAVAMTSADGYPNGQPAAGIQPGDSLVFAIKILSAS
jgi:FKBP-type peptidyl-prolyl cis-trans isomerase